MEELDWKGGRTEGTPLSILPFFHPFFQSISILQWQYRYIFHKIVRLNLPHFHVRSK